MKAIRTFTSLFNDKKEIFSAVPLFEEIWTRTLLITNNVDLQIKSSLLKNLFIMMKSNENETYKLNKIKELLNKTVNLSQIKNSIKDFSVLVFFLN